MYARDRSIQRGRFVRGQITATSWSASEQVFLVRKDMSLAHPSVRGCDRSPDGTGTSPEADPPVVDVSDHGVTIIRPHRRTKR
jgi:hypothetical protein